MQKNALDGRRPDEERRPSSEQPQSSDLGHFTNDHQVLILGYGNVDRQDDGVAWHVLALTAKRLHLAFPSSPEEEIRPFPQGPDFLFVLQLMPEHAETISQYRRVCFVDAHTGRVPREIEAEGVVAEFQNSPFTHHLTPASCLALAHTLYHSQTRAILVSIRGYEFGFSRSLSERTSQLAEEAAGLILTWIKKGPFPEEGEK
jgi:hydrogenase maturation protease